VGQVTVDVDAMILLDVSGSVNDPNWDKEVEVSKKVIDTLWDEVDNNHKMAGYAVWASKVETGNALTDLATHPGVVQNNLEALKVEIAGSRLYSGGTLFSHPLAECANQLLNNPLASQTDSAFRMCMLITDGEASPQVADDCQSYTTPWSAGGTFLDTSACTNVCGELSLPANTGDCTAKKMAKELRDQKNISIVTVCVACPNTNAKIDAYCYSDCAHKHGDGTHAACKTAVGAYTDAQLEECTHYLIADNFLVLDEVFCYLCRHPTMPIDPVLFLLFHDLAIV